MLETSVPEEICRVCSGNRGRRTRPPATGIYLLTEDTDILEPAALTERVENLFDGDVPTYTSDDDLAWDVFETNEPRVISDFETTPSVADRDTPVRSGIIVPLGDHGIFITASTSPRDFDRIDFDLLRVLATNTETALSRAERERALARQRDELTTLNRINAIVRDINQALVAAPSREEMERTVCERFAGSDVYHGALIATLSSAKEGLTVRTASGIDDDYLERLRS